MTTTTRDHVVAANHLVLGPSNFIVLRLPDNWDVRLGRHPADVDYLVAFEGVRWAQEGRADALLMDMKARRAIELGVRTARGSIPSPRLLEPRRGSCTLGGHAAAYAVGAENLGLLGTKRYNVLHIAYRCDETGRSIDLRFMHKGDTATLEGFLDPLKGTRCH